MRRQDVKVGEDYLKHRRRYGLGASSRLRVLGHEVADVREGYDYRRRTVKRNRIRVVPVNEETGAAIENARELLVTGAELEMSWSDYGEEYRREQAERRQRLEKLARWDAALVAAGLEKPRVELSFGSAVKIWINEDDQERLLSILKEGS